MRRDIIMTQEVFSSESRSSCFGCGRPILDKFILRVAPDLEWHASCLKCHECNTFLDENCTCYFKEGKTLCKEDYVKLYGVKCAKCGNTFDRDDLVMRAKNRVFHVDCFTCVACQKHLLPGDEFALKDKHLFCKEDHPLEMSPSDETALAEESVKLEDSEDLEHSVISYPESRSGQENGGNVSDTSSNSNSGGNCGTKPERKRNKEHKPTRVRTVLNEKQLHTLRTCYSANPRPDALMKEQLVEMTGLSPRVIRVWFQNKRCKDKKKQILMKHIHNQQDKNGRLQGPLQGVQMIAQEPVLHEMSALHPVEVQSFQQQPPWKALSDFALQSELDHAPFQQLVNSFEHDTSQTPPPGLSYINGDEYQERSSLENDYSELQTAQFC